MVAQIPANKPFYSPADKMLWHTTGFIGQVAASHGGGVTDLNTSIRFYCRRLFESWREKNAISGNNEVR
jgi:hypothetical protein